VLNFWGRFDSRAGWGDAQAYLEQRAGVEFDPDLVAAFIKMLRDGETKASAV